MHKGKTYEGQLLISQPRCISKFFYQSLILIVRHDATGAWGIMLNKPLERRDLTFDSIMVASGIDSAISFDNDIYLGGPVETGKISVVHSLDWMGLSTISITDQIGVTTDISVLTALAQNRGPSKFRAACGICGWSSNQLEGEQSGKLPWYPEHRWLTTSADIDLVFDYDGRDQWKQAIDRSAKNQIDQWFNNLTSPFQDLN